MPVSTSTRSSTAYAIPASPFTPSCASPNSTKSPSTNIHVPTVTSAGVKINVVTRTAIEGKTKQGEEGASIKMYLKVSYSENVNSKYDKFDSLLSLWIL